MKVSALELAGQLGGKVIGNGNVEVSSCASIGKAQSGDLTFLSNPKYVKELKNTKASVVLVNESLQEDLTQYPQITFICVEDSYYSFAFILRKIQEYYTLSGNSGIHEQTSIDDTAKLGEDLFVGAFTHIGRNVEIGDNVKIFQNCTIGDNVKIGDNSIIYPMVSIYYRCELGQNVIVHSGTVIGSDGFGFAPNKHTGQYEKIPQVGNVIIEDNVEIGANATIDRATLDSTIIRKGAKIDNLVQIAHNVEIGENTVLAAQAGIAGSTEIGASCMFGGQVGIAGHLKVAKGTQLQAKSGVLSNITEENGQWGGVPLVPHMQFMRRMIVLRNIVDMDSKLKDVERRLQKVENKNS